MKEPKYDILRGRHRKRASKETKRWEQELLVPERPPWMDPTTYVKLAQLREKL